MWICSEAGFFSVVREDEQSEVITVRARQVQDLANLCRLTGERYEIIHTPHRDYSCRIFMTTRQWLRLITLLGEGVDYPNFKERVSSTPDQRDKVWLYHQLWLLMSQLEDETQGGDSTV